MILQQADSLIDFKWLISDTDLHKQRNLPRTKISKATMDVKSVMVHTLQCSLKGNEFTKEFCLERNFPRQQWMQLYIAYLEKLSIFMENNLILVGYSSYKY